MLTLLAIATTVLIAFGVFVWLQGHRSRDDHPWTLGTLLSRRGSVAAVL